MIIPRQHWHFFRCQAVAGGKGGTWNPWSFYVTLYNNLINLPSVTEFAPYQNNIQLGSAAHKWSQVFASTAAISTSDERQKEDIQEYPDELLDAWEEINWVQFKFKDSVKEKGDNARIHAGLIAQRIASVFERHGIDPAHYGLYCYNEWEGQEPVLGYGGQVDMEGWEAGNVYSVRYEECFAIEAAMQRRKAQRLEERLLNIERMLAQMQSSRQDK